MKSRYSIESLRKMKRDALIEIARKQGLRGYSKLNKNRLCDVIFESISFDNKVARSAKNNKTLSKKPVEQPSGSSKKASGGKRSKKSEQKEQKNVSVIADGGTRPIARTIHGNRDLLNKAISIPEPLEKSVAVLPVHSKSSRVIKPQGLLQTTPGPKRNGRKRTLRTLRSLVKEDQLTGELPAKYGEDRIVMQVRDPYWAHLYWEISEVTVDNLRKRLGEKGFLLSKYVLRVYQGVTDPDKVSAAPYSFDIIITGGADNWYLHLNKPQTSFIVDLGLITHEGEFVRIAQSNSIFTPRDSASESSEVKWFDMSPQPEKPAPDSLSRDLANTDSRKHPAEDGNVRCEEPEVNSDYFELALGTVPGSPGSERSIPFGNARLFSADISSHGVGRFPPVLFGPSSEVLASRGFGFHGVIPPVSSPHILGGLQELSHAKPADRSLPAVSSEILTVPTGMTRENDRRSGKKFWLVVDTELIVYGATEPDAKVTLQGRPVKLNPDGTFSLRFALPDGEQVIPVRGVNKDGDMEITITPVVLKETR